MKFFNSILSQYKSYRQNMSWYHECVGRTSYWYDQYDALDCQTDMGLVTYIDEKITYWATELDETVEALDESLF